MAGTSVPLDDAARAALESLGYVAGDGAAAGDGGADLPDPKRMIVVQNDIAAAQGLLSEDRPDAALALLRRALARDPGNKAIHFTMGMASARLGRHEAAVDSYLRCLELPPHRNDRVPRFELASSYLLLGEHDKAVPQLEAVLETSPEDEDAWYHLGLAHSGAGRPEQAREAWDRALAIDPAHRLTLDALRGAAR